ncbi:hypothetical protein C8J56DRAFT_720921, partial [Mycena floridula]
MTTYKAQGLTFKKVIVDLASCRGSEAPYVMVSRVKSLEGLIVLRPFKLKHITSRPNEDVRQEHKRQRVL